MRKKNEATILIYQCDERDVQIINEMYIILLVQNKGKGKKTTFQQKNGGGSTFVRKKIEKIGYSILIF